MALRLALVIDGNAAGAAKAAEEAQREIRAVAAAADQSSQAIATANQRTTAAAASGAAAINSVGGASRFAAQMSRQLSFQLIDIAQTIPLAFQSPLYALQNVGFQLAQIGQLYMGQGGLRQALADSVAQVARFGPTLLRIGGPIGIIAAGIAGMTAEINRNSDAQVGFGDVALGVVQVVRDGIYSLLKPAIDAVAPWFAAAWDAVVAGVKVVGNTIIGSFAAAFEDVKFVWNNLPNALGAAAIGTANTVLGVIERMINGATGLINSLIEKVNAVGSKVGVTVGTIGEVSFGRFENPFADALAGDVAGRNAAVGAALSRDYLGEFFSAVQSRAVANSLEETDEKAKGAARSVGGLGRVFDAAREKMQIYGGAIKGFFSDLTQGLRSGANLWETFANAGLSALDSIIQRIAGSALDSFLGSLFGVGGRAGFVGAGGVPVPGRNPFFGGFRAEGGPIEQGKWYIAGEHGREPIWGGGPGAFALGYPRAGGNAGGRVGIDVGVYVDDDGRLGAIARQAGRDGGAEAADVRVRTFSKDELPDRMREVERHPRRRGG